MQLRELARGFGVYNEEHQIEAIRRVFAFGVSANHQRAEKIRAGEISIFEKECFVSSGRVAWHRDPVQKREWPASFYTKIDTRDGFTVGGVKWVWELNRHHHLVTLAKAYLFSGDESFAGEVIAQMLDWIEQNPPLMGVNWTSPLEIAIRLINWTWALAFIRGSKVLARDDLSKILGSIWRQARHVERHRSAYSSANNHLIGEAAGLAVVGLVFPELPDSERWRDLGLSILASEAEKQILPDGVPAEQAFSYLLFVLDFNLIAWETARRAGIDPDSRWLSRLDASSTFIASLLAKRESMPAVGDSDDGMVVRLDDGPDADNARSILASAAAILGRADLKATALVWDEKSHWLLGDWGFERFRSLGEATPITGSRLFPDGGYAILQSDRAHVVWDCGPLGYLSTAAHGHADSLSLTLAVDQKPILVDAGTYAYQEGGAWRQYFRSTRAHNTVVVEDLDQSEMLGDFLWGRRACSSIEAHALQGDPAWVMGSHDGYRERNVTHRRGVFLWRNGVLVVIDQLQGAGRVRIEQCWHFAEHVGVDLRPDRIDLNLESERFFAFADSGGRLERKLVRGELDPIQGWISPHYGVKRPAPVLCFSGDVQLPAILSFAICWSHLTDERVRTAITDSRMLFEDGISS